MVGRPLKQPHHMTDGAVLSHGAGNLTNLYKRKHVKMYMGITLISYQLLTGEAHPSMKYTGLLIGNLVALAGISHDCLAQILGALRVTTKRKSGLANHFPNTTTEQNWAKPELFVATDTWMTSPYPGSQRRVPDK